MRLPRALGAGRSRRDAARLAPLSGERRGGAVVASVNAGLAVEIVDAVAGDDVMAGVGVLAPPDRFVDLDCETGKGGGTSVSAGGDS